MIASEKSNQIFNMVNYKHLHYFWMVAKEGSITRASEKLHLTPQTISGQLSLLESHLDVQLFNRTGRRLELTETGKFVLKYAEEIFSLGGELEASLHQLPNNFSQTLKVGVADVVPKSIAHHILSPVLKMQEPVRLICRETSLDSLLAELSVHRLDLVLADRPIPSTVSTHGYSHKLGECGVSFFATTKITSILKGTFPQCLNNAPLLLPGNGSQLRSEIDKWLEKSRLAPYIVAEFDDSALMKVFGQEDAGIFIAPSAIEVEVETQYHANCIGRTNEVREHFYAISIERKILHPVVTIIMDSARESLFSNQK